MALHTYAVAKYRAAAERTIGVNCYDSDGQSQFSEVPGKAVNQCAFAYSGRTGYADAIGMTGVVV